MSLLVAVQTAALQQGLEALAFGGSREPHPLPTGGRGMGLEDQDWQSAGVRGVSFFSAAYLAAVALTSGLMI